MKAYSVDLRAKVLRAVDQGYPREEIIKLLGVSRATIKHYLKQRRETGSVAPKAIPGRPPKKLGPLKPIWWRSCKPMTTWVWRSSAGCGSRATE